MQENNNQDKVHERCERVLQKTLLENEAIDKLIQSIEKLGCKIPNDFFECKDCGDLSMSGGFTVPMDGEINYKPKIVINQSIPLETESFEKTLLHELIHAHDYCRAKLDWKNCLHHACTEIRAANLSGECSWWHELHRGNTQIVGGGMECVKRRAKLSVAKNPYCEKTAHEAVETVFDICYRDTTPYNQHELWKL